MTNKIEKKLKRLNSISELESIIACSEATDIFIFKHSSRCGISAVVKSTFKKWLNSTENKNLAFVIDVIENRSLSKEIEQKFNIKHESPQLIWIRSGKAIWRGSHFEISQSNLNKNLI